MAVNSYPLGSIVRLTGTFRVGATLTDPATVTVKVRTPAGVITTSTYAASQVVKDGTGIYHLDYTPAATGEYHWRAEGTGAATAAAEDKFVVSPSAF